MIAKKWWLIVLCMTGFSPACNLSVLPTDALNTENVAGTPDGLPNVMNGCYALLKNNVMFNGYVDPGQNYLWQYYQFSDYGGDDIVCGQVTEHPLFYSFTYTHSPDQENIRFFWYISYKIINGVNTVIELGEKIPNPGSSVKQLIGEAYFLRAFLHFNLLRVFAKPYTQAPESPGVIIRRATTDDALAPRATVKEVYNFVVEDLKKAASLMDQPRGAQYASKEAALGYLSRIYLYMNDADNTIVAANAVINSGRFQLESAEGFKTYFQKAIGSPESIFLVAQTKVDSRGKEGSVASMVYSDGNSGWGEEFASASLRKVMSEHPEDVRWSYILPLKDAATGQIARKNGIEIYYITKFSFQDGDPNLSSPVMLRLSEVYLNRAEAYAMKGNVTGALNDVDEIRKRRGLQGALYNGQVPRNKSLLETVLLERRLELAFEGHRTFDVYRNKLNMVRNYWGYHLSGLQETDVNLAVEPTGYPNITINWNDPKTIFYIPVDEILANPACKQNP
jgi:hypothetical protein